MKTPLIFLVAAVTGLAVSLAPAMSARAQTAATPAGGTPAAETPAAETTTIKIATLAPPGSAWAKIMARGARELEEKTQGRIKLRYFWGGQQGDERDVVRKMKLGQLDGAALTAVGLGLVRSDVRVLELPFLFRSYEEIDYVRSKMEGEFERKFEEAGYILLSWGDVGWVHYYSTTPIRSKADLQKIRTWSYAEDPIVRAMQKRLGLSGVPLGVPEVLSALQTGQIQAVYGPPLACVAMQWYTKVRYATAKPSSYAIGALVLRKEIWDRLRPEDRALIRERSTRTRAELTALVRRDNERAKKAMEKMGIQFLQASPAMEEELVAAGRLVWQDLVGTVYPRELLDRVQAHLAEIRKK